MAKGKQLKVVFVIPCYNAESNIVRLGTSLMVQSDDRWSAIIVDDISTDNTWEAIQRLPRDKFTTIKNKEKKYALKNVVESIQMIDDKDAIVAILDGDDSICNPDTVKLLIERYTEGNLDAAWTGHRWDINEMNISKSMPQDVDPYQWPWSSSHLKTFRSGLMDLISHKNFKNYKGEWFKRGYDQALMLPILYLANKFEYIDEICYRYNIDSASIPSEKREWSEMEQISTINFVRARGFVERD
tara:strand:- start:206 stop:934 length:729 start_codon:yes stop_codon:yes gene_type:complete